MTALIVIPALVAALLYGTSAYFFRFVFARQEKVQPWAELPGFILLRDRAFFERPGREQLEITSRDGLRLRAWLYDRGSDVTVILCHGYRGGPEELSGIAARLWEEGMNVLLICQRAHGLSEGSFFTMGTREKLDAVDWAREIARRAPEGKIVLFGWSMGGNTVMGAVGEALPANVKCAVEDSGYENLRTQLMFSCRKTMPRLPAKGFLIALLGLYCRLFRGFAIDDPRGASLARSRTPMLFIHGTADNVVPYAELDRCYGACASEKRRSVYRDAPHVSSCGSDPERYFGELLDFIGTYTKS